MNADVVDLRRANLMDADVQAFANGGPRRLKLVRSSSM